MYVSKGLALLKHSHLLGKINYSSLDLYSTHQWSVLFSDDILCFQEHIFFLASLNQQAT